MHQHRVVKDMCKPSPHHLNEALKHALYRPAVFFKGIVCSLLDVSGDSWLVGPIIGPTRVFLDKKHALPYKVLNTLIFHFIRLSNMHAQGTLPVLWHRAC